MAKRLFLNERQVWLKQYRSGNRRVALGLLDRIARGLSIEALRPPPHHVGEQAQNNEARRVRELKAADVNVPEVLGEGRAMLLLADIGISLSGCLKQARGNPARRDHLVSLAIDSIADVHAKGLYLGNPVPRNMTFGNDCIGFLDFEEDPGEIMSRDVAQARDWLLFVHGTARFYPDEQAALATLLKAGLDRSSPDVRQRVIDAGSRLSRIAAMFWPFQRGNGKTQSALRTLRHLAGHALLVAMALASLALGDDDGFPLHMNIMGIFV
ncbi:serine/threonine protein phosphatase [Dokdonella sp.]|uniref:serine/threonine protein phosphatase n=1 Tax=Dokdonella sp. TaxID=2291710 RepID=UPI003528E837